MTDLLRPILQLSVLLPGMLLAYLPMKPYLKFRPARLAAMAVSLCLAVCLSAGFLCFYFKLPVWMAAGPAVFLCGYFYVHSLKISSWKSISVLLAVCGLFTCLDSTAKAIHWILYPGSRELWLSLEAAAAYVLMCWICILLSWYPATHPARSLVEDESFAQTWYVFWILPILFIGVNIFMTPVYPETLQHGRMSKIYITFSFILLGLLALFYFMFYLMANSLNRNDRLRKENMFLSMQQTQYQRLRAAISETREARHDMRHHLNALQALAERKDWEALSYYLANARKSIPDTILNLCENTAADAVASHYALLYRKNEIPFSMKLALPKDLPVSEVDFCLVLSNLLENALEASLHTQKSRQYIQVQAYLHSNYIVLLTVENTFDGTIKERNGFFQSSKHPGNGVGTQSVLHIAEKDGGSCRFTHDKGKFCANVMLRGEPK